MPRAARGGSWSLRHLELASMWRQAGSHRPYGLSPGRSRRRLLRRLWTRPTAAPSAPCLRLLAGGNIPLDAPLFVVSFRLRSTVGQRPLKPRIVVRIHGPEPLLQRPLPPLNNSRAFTAAARPLRCPGTEELSMTKRRLVRGALAAVLTGCGPSAAPAAPRPACSTTITIGRLPNGSPASPGQGPVWTAYFGGTALTAQSSVYVVDISFGSAGCSTAWTASSADTTAVQLSPAIGVGRGQVELFMPDNAGAQPRSTVVTIADQTASITQAGR